MVIFISIIVIVAIIVIVFFLKKIVKEEKEYFEEEKLAMEEEERNNPQPQPHTIVNKKAAIVIRDEEFEKMLFEAQNNPSKMDSLKKVIQDNLRSCIKIKDMEGSRKCNAQLKQISLIEKEGTQD